jgi:2-dehydro-3-deoxyphosphogluconate aldolase / (4S)-4-hydroxy-2-oxoglutarate aldolase
MTDQLGEIRPLGIVPVIVIDDPANALPLADALMEGGLPCAEVTFRTPAAVESRRRIVEERPTMLVGAGTVLTPDQAAQAKAAGATFIVSPGFHPRVVDYCLEHDMTVFPGVCTPSEVAAVLEKGIRVMKFFPAEPMGGLTFLKAIAAPFGAAEFIPTGGVTASLLGEYLRFKRVVACGGSWMAPGEWIAAKQFDRIRDETRKAVQAVRAARGEPS